MTANTPASEPATGPWTPELVEFFIGIAGERKVVDDEGEVFATWSWAHQTPTFLLTAHGFDYDPGEDWHYLIEVAGPDTDNGSASTWLGPFIDQQATLPWVHETIARLLNHGLARATVHGWNAT